MDYPTLLLELLKALGPPALALVAAAVSVYLTNRLTFDRNHKEKMADLRRVAYSSIISELLKIQDAAEYAMMHLREDASSFKDDPKAKKVDKDIADAVKALRLSYHGNYLLLSKEFIRFYELLSASLRTLEDYPGHAISEKLHPVIKREAARLIEVAHRELYQSHIKRRFPRIRALAKWMLDPATWSRRARTERTKAERQDLLNRLRRLSPKRPQD